MMSPKYDLGNIVTLEAAILDHEEGTAIIVTDGHYLQREKEGNLMPGLPQEELHKRALEEIQGEIKRIDLEPVADMKTHWLFCLGGVLTTALRLEAISKEEYRHYNIVKECLWKSITEKC